MKRKIMDSFMVQAPASTANLGPAFDCLGLALDLWNEVRFTLGGEKLDIQISGEGESTLARDEGNLITIAFKRVYAEAGEKPAKGIQIESRNRIPLGSGLGSSSAAILCGLLGANQLLKNKFGKEALLQLGAELEGHADNLAAALYGGLVLVSKEGDEYVPRSLEFSDLQAVVVLPEIEVSTEQARKAMPTKVPLADAVFNIAKGISLAEALRDGNISQLARAMEDKLHQPYRLKLYPGAEQALRDARAAGAAAALSGAGPSLIAFVEAGREKAIAEAMRAPFMERGIGTRHYLLKSTERGAELVTT
jgi:homoserine kinase